MSDFKEYYFASKPADDLTIRFESLTLPDGTDTPVLHHLPPDDARRLPPVLYVHGIESHPGWFIASVSYTHLTLPTKA